MKKPPLFFALLFFANLLFAQQAYTCRDVLASGGGDAVFSGKKFEYTLGEPVIQTIGNGNQRLTQGFQQPEICPLLPSTGVSGLTAASGLAVFPNPTTGELHLRFDTPTGKIYRLQVFSAVGQLVQTLPESDDTRSNSVDCEALPSGLYILLARTASGDLFFQVPFVKTGR